MKKTIVRSFTILLVLAAALALLAGCQGRLPEGMDKTRMEEDSKAIVDAVNARDYETVVAMFSDEHALPLSEWQTALDPISDQLGAFEGYKGTSYITTEDDTYGELVTMMLESQYANGKVVWLVSFDSDHSIMGLVVRNA